MSIGLTPTQAINTTYHILRQLSQIVMWLVFTAFHLALAVVCLVLLWAFQIGPQDIARWFQELLQTETAQGAAAVFGFLGLSGLAAIVGYVRLWRKIYGSIVAEYLTRGLAG